MRTAEKKNLVDRVSDYRLRSVHRLNRNAYYDGAFCDVRHIANIYPMKIVVVFVI